MNKEQLEKFDKKFDVYKAPNCWLPNLDNKKMYTLITEYNKSIKQFISDILKAQRQEIIEQIKEKIKEDNKPLSYGATLNNDICEYGCVYRVLEIIKTLTKQK